MIDYSVQITLEEKQYTLVCDLNAMSLIEEQIEKNVLQEDFWENISATELRATLYAFLNCRHPDLPLKEVGSMINIGNMAYITQKMMEAWSKAMPDESGEKKIKEKSLSTG